MLVAPWSSTAHGKRRLRSLCPRRHSGHWVDGSLVSSSRGATEFLLLQVGELGPIRKTLSAATIGLSQTGWEGPGARLSRLVIPEPTSRPIVSPSPPLLAKPFGMRTATQRRRV